MHPDLCQKSMQAHPPSYPRLGAGGPWARWRSDCISYVRWSDAAGMKSKRKWSAGHFGDACMCTGVNAEVPLLSTCNKIAQSTFILSANRVFSQCRQSHLSHWKCVVSSVGQNYKIQYKDLQTAVFHILLASSMSTSCKRYCIWFTLNFMTLFLQMTAMAVCTLDH